MSHILEEYAKNLGVKISKPMVAKHFWPIPEEKYISFSLEGKMPSKQYRYYDLVIEMIYPYLKKNNISILQIGSSEAGTIKGIKHALLDLSFKQNAWILSKSLLHVSVDGVLSHYANSIGVPSVVLFGNVYASVSKGFWHKNQELIEAPWPVKPSLSHEDPNDSINKIKPEIIALSILKKLGIAFTTPITTKFIGSMFHHEIIEIVPNFFFPIEKIKNKHIFLRPDMVFDRDCFFNWCEYLTKFSIFSKEPIPINFLEAHRNKIINLSFIASPQTSLTEEYLDQVKSTGASVTILVPKKEDLPEMRERFFDFSVQWYTKASKKSIEDSGIDFSKARFKSSKIILGDGKQYCSQYHFNQGKNFVDKNFPLVDDEVLLEDLEHFYIYE